VERKCDRCVSTASQWGMRYIGKHAAGPQYTTSSPLSPLYPPEYMDPISLGHVREFTIGWSPHNAVVLAYVNVHQRQANGGPNPKP
jgi:hypothetical protein